MSVARTPTWRAPSCSVRCSSASARRWESSSSPVRTWKSSRTMTSAASAPQPDHVVGQRDQHRECGGERGRRQQRDEEEARGADERRVLLDAARAEDEQEVQGVREEEDAEDDEPEVDALTRRDLRPADDEAADERERQPAGEVGELVVVVLAAEREVGDRRGEAEQGRGGRAEQRHREHDRDERGRDPHVGGDPDRQEVAHQGDDQQQHPEAERIPVCGIPCESNAHDGATEQRDLGKGHESANARHPRKDRQIAGCS